MGYIKQCSAFYLKDALELGLYDEFSFDQYCNGNVEITNEEKMKILSEYIK